MCLWTCMSYDASVVALTVDRFAGSHSSRRNVPNASLVGTTYVPSSRRLSSSVRARSASFFDRKPECHFLTRLPEVASRPTSTTTDHVLPRLMTVPLILQSSRSMFRLGARKPTGATGSSTASGCPC